MKEVLSAACGHEEIDLEVWDYLMGEIRGVHQERPPLKFHEWLSFVNPDANPGYPWVLKWATKKDMFLAVKAQDFYVFVAMVEAMIVGGPECFDFIDQCAEYLSLTLIGGIWFLWKAHSKEDKYAFLKLVEERYRAIYGPDVVFLYLVQKYSIPLIQDVECFLPWYVIVTSNQTWGPRVYERFAGEYTAGADYTAFDKSQSENKVALFVFEFLVIAGAPEKLARLLSTVVAKQTLVLPDGELVMLGGGNPSGNPLTTILNSFGCRYLWFSCFRKMGVPLEKLVMWAIQNSGDDGLMAVVGPASPSHGWRPTMFELRQACELHPLQSRVRVKLETLLDGEPYPPGVCAPFLSRFYVREGIPYTVPVKPTRGMSRWQFREPSTTDQEYADRLVGVRAYMSPFYCAWMQGHAVPESVQHCLCAITEFRLSHSWLNWDSWLPAHELVASHLCYE
jgi:hypothetical protein